ncbi:MAG TPA: 23S rRNA (uracil(1939)-C(5))-methyltransferase RlmD [Candidatus Acidoferrales bacterium]|nr:23S rRNA (uracil(1939)-C(5))-methyltransferase RlmD [Candidatus Acidoferrales bacterium]
MRAKIEKLVYGGEGLAHENGETLFVPFVLPGEDVEVQIAERKKKFARGQVRQIIAASADRIQPRCPHFGVCGGCDYQHIPYEMQLHIKEQIFRETLHRLGRIDWQGPVTVHASPPWEYRNRVQWKIRPGASERSGDKSAGTAQIGYFRARSSVLCPVEQCSILSPALFAAFSSLRSALEHGKVSPLVREVETFADASDETLLLNVTCASLPRSSDSIAQDISVAVPSATSILLRDVPGERMALHGPGSLNYRAGGNNFQVGHLSFFQVNRYLVDEVASVVSASAGAGELAFDLYAGTGLFAVGLAEHFSRVEAIESDPASARDLERNAGLSAGIRTHNDTAEGFLSRWKRKRDAASPEAIVLDPPRAGLEEGALRQIIAIRPRRVLYVSCDPSTLARDLAKLCTQAYTLNELHLLDMFPQTYHIESFALLESAP